MMEMLYKFKIGRKILELLHSFGLVKMKGVIYLLDKDGAFNIQTHYTIPLNFYNTKIPNWNMDDVVDFVYDQLRLDPKLEFKCRLDGFVTVNWIEATSGPSKFLNPTFHIFPYKDGLLYRDMDTFLRERKIDNLLT